MASRIAEDIRGSIHAFEGGARDAKVRDLIYPDLVYADRVRREMVAAGMEP
jgi:hypothetical protein